MPITEEVQQKFDHDLEFGRLGEDFVKNFQNENTKIEVKTERKGSALRPSQLEFQAECQRAGIDYFVWRSSDEDCWGWLVENGYVVEQ